MKKVCIWLSIISSIVLLATLGVVGVKILDNNYNFTVEIIITIVFGLILFGTIFYKLISNRCPHCGKINDSLTDKFCSHCGKEK